MQNQNFSAKQAEFCFRFIFSARLKLNLFVISKSYATISCQTLFMRTCIAPHTMHGGDVSKGPDRLTGIRDFLAQRSIQPGEMCSWSDFGGADDVYPSVACKTGG